MTFGAQEIGGQVAWYPLERFESLVVLGEVLYVHVSGTLRSVNGIGAGIAVGPLVGYKYISDGGFTLLVHGGVEYVAIEAETTDGESSATEERSNVIPAVNFNLGWSF